MLNKTKKSEARKTYNNKLFDTTNQGVACSNHAGCISFLDDC